MSHDVHGCTMILGFNDKDLRLWMLFSLLFYRHRRTSFSMSFFPFNNTSSHEISDLRQPAFDSHFLYESNLGNTSKLLASRQAWLLDNKPFQRSVTIVYRVNVGKWLDDHLLQPSALPETSSTDDQITSSGGEN